MSQRKSIVVVSVAGAVAFAAGLVASPSFFQPDQPERDEAAMAWMQPGEHHKALEPLIGEWEGTVKMWMTPGAEPMESVGSVTREWAMDGRFVIEHVTGSMEGSDDEFRGMGIIGYNTVEHRYESVWIENMATHMSFMNGEMSPDGKTMTFEGDVLDPMTGQRVHSRYVSDMSDPDRHTSVGYGTGPDGKEFKSFEGVMERKH
ncbi:MAG TPA: DUF1579 domain-containing protein [Phycisphaerales bacterium]|nr:DUF1579 domain-containing protein [Phycisphaerales bacterium]